MYCLFDQHASRHRSNDRGQLAPGLKVSLEPLDGVRSVRQPEGGVQGRDFTVQALGVSTGQQGMTQTAGWGGAKG